MKQLSERFRFRRAPHTNRLSVGEPRDAHHQQVTTSPPLLPLLLPPPKNLFYSFFALFPGFDGFLVVYVLFSLIWGGVVVWSPCLSPPLRAREGLPHI